MQQEQGVWREKNTQVLQPFLFATVLGVSMLKEIKRTVIFYPCEKPFKSVICQHKLASCILGKKSPISLEYSTKMSVLNVKIVFKFCAENFLTAARDEEQGNAWLFLSWVRLMRLRIHPLRMTKSVWDVWKHTHTFQLHVKNVINMLISLNQSDIFFKMFSSQVSLEDPQAYVSM